MMGKTHLAVGVASALLVTQPQTPSQFAVAVIGGALGGVASDIDVKLNFNNQFAKNVAWDALGSEIAALLITFGLLVVDFIFKGGICEKILQHLYLSIPGLAMVIILVIFGERDKKHRGKTHSLAALFLTSVGMFLIHPNIGIAFAIGFASHIITDLLNKSKVQVFYPFNKKGFCFNLCYAEGLANQILCGVSMAVILVYAYLLQVV